MWLGTCIGKRNYHYFFAFVSLLWIEITLSMTLSVLNLYLHFQLAQDEWASKQAAATSYSEEPPTLIDSLAAYPFSLILLVYSLVFFVFLTVLVAFHTILICESKTTQEKLKRDKGVARGTYSRSPHRHGGNKCCSNWTNCSKALCARTTIYDSKMSWELYLYSLGYLEELN